MKKLIKRININYEKAELYAYEGTSYACKGQCGCYLSEEEWFEQNGFCIICGCKPKI